MSCQVCGKPKNRNSKKYCSLKCSGQGRRSNKKCSMCDVTIKYRQTFCNDCKQYREDNNLHKKFRPECSLKELIENTNYYKNCLIYSQARTIYHKQYPNAKCLLCGYSKTIQVCHIKPVREFNLSATLSEINHLTNLIGLCPTHHWEMDHNLMSDDDKLKLKEIVNENS